MIFRNEGILLSRISVHLHGKYDDMTIAEQVELTNILEPFQHWLHVGCCTQSIRRIDHIARLAQTSPWSTLVDLIGQHTTLNVRSFEFVLT